MHSLLISPVIALIALTPLAEDDDPGKRVTMRSWREATVPLRHVRPLAGRQLYHGNNPMRFGYPGLIAANPAERAAGYGFELRVADAHRLLAPVDSADAARELARLFGGGTVVADRAAYDAVRAIATEAAPTIGGWRVSVEPGEPAAFGERVARAADGFEVVRVIYTSSGFGRLSIVEERYAIPAKGRVERTAKTWIAGPPQSWQSSGDDDAEDATARYAAVQRFRIACMRALAAGRTIEPFARVFATDPTFAAVRAAVGDPATDIGSGIHIYYYPLGDGTAVVVGAAGDDRRLSYARHVEVVDRSGRRPRLGRTIRDFPVGPQR